jgi:hypothetical protein
MENHSAEDARAYSENNIRSQAFCKIIQVFGEFKLLGFHLSAISGNFAAQRF